MERTKKVALIGDFSPDVLAHQAIPQALALAGFAQDLECVYQWLATDQVRDTALGEFDGFWCVPASPYHDMDGALTAIRYARENMIPFLGTCGGYQHAALEYARSVLGHSDADNAEVNSNTSMPLINALACKLVEKSDLIRFLPHCRIASIYQGTEAEEDYHCSFGVNQEYLSLFDSSSMRFTGFDREGDPRVLELVDHPFFIGTAYQPERTALSGRSHPLIEAFVKALAAPIRSRPDGTQDTEQAQCGSLNTVL